MLLQSVIVTSTDDTGEAKGSGTRLDFQGSGPGRGGEQGL